MNTEELMQIALEMSAFEKIPADSQIFVRGDNIKKILFGIDVDSAGLLLAKQLNFDAVIAHHPPGDESRIYGIPEVMLRHIEQMKNVGISEKDAKKALDEGSPVGKFFVAISAGTSGGAAIAKAYFKAGINTLLYMHLGEGDYKKLKKEKIKGNLIVTGHMPSDSIGINIYLNELEKRGIFVQRFSGVIA